MRLSLRTSELMNMCGASPDSFLNLSIELRIGPCEIDIERKDRKSTFWGICRGRCVVLENGGKERLDGVSDTNDGLVTELGIPELRDARVHLDEKLPGVKNVHLFRLQERQAAWASL